jgi:outer membrane protein OmpA-like peptidoglycan-associated protein
MGCVVGDIPRGNAEVSLGRSVFGEVAELMMKSMHLRAGYAAALAAGVLLAGCSSSEPDFPDAPAGPQNTTSSSTTTPDAPTPAAGTPAANADGTFPDVNTVPTQRPSSTIQDLNQAPEGLSGAQSGTQYGEELIGGPTSSAPPPPPPPEPDPAADLPPIPEPGVTTESSNSGSSSSETSTYTEPVAAAAPEPQPEPTPEPTAEATTEPEPVAEVAPEPAPQPAPAPQTAAVESAPLQPLQGAAEAEPVTPVGTPQQGSQPFQPEAQLALAPGGGPAQTAALPQAQPAYGPNYAALAPENYGIGFPQPVLPPYQGYGNAQAMYRSPYASPPTNYGGATIVGANQQVQPQVLQPPSNYPTYGVANGQTNYGQQAYGVPGYSGGQPVGMIYFRDGSAKLSSDDRKVLKQIAEMHKSYGGVVRVVGHASMRTGSMDLVSHQKANQRISEARAKAVARQLQHYGVPDMAIQVSAAGDSQPIYAEMMPNGEAANRRAEVYLSAY